MHALLCDTCRQPITREGYELSLLPGTVVNRPDEHSRFSSINAGVITASLCRRCGERFGAILRRKLHAPCPTCEIAPLREGDARAAGAEERLRRAS